MPDLPERAPIADAALSVVLVAHNAGAHVAAVIQSWVGAVGALQRDFEILLIDDGSTDATSERANASAAAEPRVRVFRHPRRLGFGAALRTALAAAKYPLFFHAPCTPSCTPAHLQKLLEHIDLVDIVVGYRAGCPMPALYRCVGFTWRCLLRILPGVWLDARPGWLGGKATLYGGLVRLLFGVRIGDVDSPVKLFRRAVFERMPIQSAGPFAHAEVLAKANFLDGVLDEVPLDLVPAWDTCCSRLGDGWQVFVEPAFAAAGPPETESAGSAP